MTSPPGRTTVRSGWRAGAGLAALYVVAAVVTSQLSPRPVLPMFDGFAPPTPYAWVNPPPERAGDNVAPRPVEREFPLDAEGSAASNASTDDAQAIVGLDKGSVPPRPPDTAVKVGVTPVDPATLGPLPAGLRAVSNAYQVALSYVPSRTPVEALAVKGTIALTAAEVGDRFLFSADGRSWQETQFRPYGQDHGVFAELGAVGWFVVARSAAAGSGSEEEETGWGVLRAILLVLVAVAPIVGAVLVVRLPSPVPAPRTGPPPAARARPTGKKKPKRRR